MATPLVCSSSHRVSCVNVGSVETWWKSMSLEHAVCLHRPWCQSCHNMCFRRNRTGLMGPWAPGLSGSGPHRSCWMSAVWSWPPAPLMHNSAANELSLSPNTPQSWRDTPSRFQTLFQMDKESRLLSFQGESYILTLQDVQKKEPQVTGQSTLGVGPISSKNWRWLCEEGSKTCSK